MKKNRVFFLAMIIIFMFTACGQPAEETPDVAPQLSHAQSICELATMECYYHNVAKFFEEDAERFLWLTWDKHFWIEYSGIVTYGIDISLVDLKVDDSLITITLPEAKVQSCTVDPDSLTEDSYIVDKNSAKISAEDEIYAFKEAQRILEENASNDKALLAEAQQRAQTLLEDYITNLGKGAGKNYSIKWNFVDADGNPTKTSYSELPSETESP